MPIHAGHSPAIISKNIQELQDAGHEHEQAVAIALREADKSKKMSQGGIARSDEAQEEQTEADLWPDKNRSIYELQEDSEDGGMELAEAPESKAFAAKLYHGEMPHSDIGPDETVAMPESKFAKEARKAIEKYKKSKKINATDL